MANLARDRNIHQGTQFSRRRKARRGLLSLVTSTSEPPDTATPPGTDDGVTIHEVQELGQPITLFHHFSFYVRRGELGFASLKFTTAALNRYNYLKSRIYRL